VTIAPSIIALSFIAALSIIAPAAYAACAVRPLER